MVVWCVVWYGVKSNVTDARCDPLAVNREKYSALHLASMYGKEDTVKVEPSILKYRERDLIIPL